MRKRIFRAAAFLVLLCVMQLGAAGAAAPQKNEKTPVTANKDSQLKKPESAVSADKLKVGLMERQASVTLTANTAFVVRDVKTNAVLYKMAAGKSLVIRHTAKGALLNDKAVLGPEWLIEPQKAGENARVKVNGKNYRGRMIVTEKKNGLQVVNELLLDEYLYGVVPEEMPPSWGIEALKAQAVAARTFALYSKNQHQKDGYDLCSSTHCQAYDGADGEQAATNTAVKETSGEILVYGNKPIYAAFHTSSGGMTENSEDVWGNYQPYLRAAEAYDAAEKSQQWEKNYTAPEIQVRLQQAGYNVGVLKSIELSPLNFKQRKTADRSVSGRVMIMKFAGSKATASLTGLEARKLFGLPSTLFDIRLKAPQAKNIDISYGNQAKAIKVDLPDSVETGKLSDAKHILSGQGGETVTFAGYGRGHGLGLSQWGAKNMAEKSNYREILQHFYQNAVLKKMQ